jgi:hypothetical protein
VKYGLVVFKENMVIDDNLHRKKMLTNTHPNEWVQYIFQLQVVIWRSKDQDGVGTSVDLDQLLEILLKLVTSWRRDIIGGIQFRFVYQSASLDYYELVLD